MARASSWFVMALMAFGVAGYAIALILAQHVRNPFDVALFGRMPMVVLLHLAGGAFALTSGTLQINTTLRQRFLQFHRWLGRLYVLAVCTAALAGLRLAIDSSGGLAAHLGFGLLAILWLYTTAQAYMHIRAGRVDLHRAWMIRSYALTLAAVTLRIYLPISLMAGLPFENSYVAISWLCWVPNLMVAHWWVRSRERRQHALGALG
jgi:uncharacterized membrane protein